MLNGKKLIGWLAALAPVVGWGQPIIIEHPQDRTVCIGEVATFTSVTDGGSWSWVINGTVIQNLPAEKHVELDISFSVTNGATTQVLKFTKYDEFFDGAEVKSAVGIFGGSSVFSNPAYLSYKINQQSLVTGLSPTVTSTTAQFNWDKQGNHTHYIFGVYDGNNNQIANQTINTNHASFDLPDNACRLEFRVTAVDVQYPECPDIEQTRYSAYLYKLDISPVTTEFDNNQTVLVSWAADGDGAFWIDVTDLESGEQFTYNGTSPFSYTPTLCGQLTNLNVSVSPAQCANDPAFTHSATVNFTIPCPTTATEATEATVTETPDQPSGTQANYPSLLLAVAAIIPLLKWQH